MLPFLERKLGDLDEVFSYETKKSVRIRDRKLGLLHRGLQGVVVFYFVILNILIKGKHLVSKNVDHDGLLYIGGEASEGKTGPSAISELGPPGRTVSFKLVTSGDWEEQHRKDDGGWEVEVAMGGGGYFEGQMAYCQQPHEVYIVAPLVLDQQTLSPSEHYGSFTNSATEQQLLSPCISGRHVCSGSKSGNSAVSNESAGVLYPSLRTEHGVVKINLGELLQATAGDDCNHGVPNSVEIIVSWTNSAMFDPFAKTPPSYTIQLQQSSVQMDLLQGAMQHPEDIRLGSKVVDYFDGKHRVVLSEDGSKTHVRLQVRGEIRIFDPIALVTTLSGVLVLLSISNTITDFIAQHALVRREEYAGLMFDTSRDFSDRQLSA